MAEVGRQLRLADAGRPDQQYVGYLLDGAACKSSCSTATAGRPASNWRPRSTTTSSRSTWGRSSTTGSKIARTRGCIRRCAAAPSIGCSRSVRCRRGGAVDRSHLHRPRPPSPRLMEIESLHYLLARAPPRRGPAPGRRGGHAPARNRRCRPSGPRLHRRHVRPTSLRPRSRRRSVLRQSPPWRSIKGRFTGRGTRIRSEAAAHLASSLR